MEDVVGYCFQGNCYGADTIRVYALDAIPLLSLGEEGDIALDRKTEKPFILPAEILWERAISDKTRSDIMEGKSHRHWGEFDKGYIGEINIEPGALYLLLNMRGRTDEGWDKIMAHLDEAYKSGKYSLKISPGEEAEELMSDIIDCKHPIRTQQPFLSNL